MEKLDITRLRSDFDGRVVTPEDAGYDQARAVASAVFDRRPAAIIRAADDADVARVVGLARETGLDLAVRSGGHSPYGTIDDGIVLDLSLLKGLDVDVAGRTAWAQTGLTAGEYTATVGAHGLATGFGDTGTVGIGGITLGGGVGFLSRRYGLTVDDLLAADVVTADGERLRVDADNHPDLFWAIRGGGGNFGVATRFKFRLHEVGPVVGGMLMLPATPEVVHSFVNEALAAPEELSMVINVMTAPPMPFVPAEHHGRIVVMALMCYAGPEEAAAPVLAPFRALATPIVDMVRPIAYPQMYPPEEMEFRPLVVTRTLFTDSVDAGTAEMIVDRLRWSDAPMRIVQLRPLGGAISRVAGDATAYAHRDRRLMGNVVSFITGPGDRPAREAWLEDVASAIRRGDDAVYVNFLGDEGADRVRAAYPGSTWDRLVRVKERYDPDNLFHVNSNVPPKA